MAWNLPLRINKQLSLVGEEFGTHRYLQQHCLHWAMPYDFHTISDKKILHPFPSESTGRTGLPADSKRAPLFLPKKGLQAVMTMHFSIKVVQPLMKAAQWHCHGNHSAGGSTRWGCTGHPPTAPAPLPLSAKPAALHKQPCSAGLEREFWGQHEV